MPTRLYVILGGPAGAPAGIVTEHLHRARGGAALRMVLRGPSGRAELTFGLAARGSRSAGTSGSPRPANAAPGRRRHS